LCIIIITSIRKINYSRYTNNACQSIVKRILQNSSRSQEERALRIAETQGFQMEVLAPSPFVIPDLIRNPEHCPPMKQMLLHISLQGYEKPPVESQCDCISDSMLPSFQDSEAFIGCGASANMMTIRMAGSEYGAYPAVSELISTKKSRHPKVPA
jgi:hypothetical protein